jgi:hypothetical protein
MKWFAEGEHELAVGIPEVVRVELQTVVVVTDIEQVEVAVRIGLHEAPSILNCPLNTLRAVPYPAS